MLESLKTNPNIPINIHLFGGKLHFAYYYFIFKFCINESFRVWCCHPNWDCSEWGEMCQCYVKSPCFKESAKMCILHVGFLPAYKHLTRQHPWILGKKSSSFSLCAWGNLNALSQKQTSALQTNNVLIKESNCIMLYDVLFAIKCLIGIKHHC